MPEIEEAEAELELDSAFTTSITLYSAFCASKSLDSAFTTSVSLYSGLP